jgi:beta-glucosidase
VSVRQGLEEAGYTITTQAAYWDAMVAEYAAAGVGNYAEGEVALTDATAQPTARTTTALYVVARNSSEGRDRTATEGDYHLHDTERANLEVLARSYRNVVVVLNVGGVVDTSFFAELNREVRADGGGRALDGLLRMSQPGHEAGRALVDVLNGSVNPSGRTADTWAAAYDLYPAAPTISFNDGKFTPEPYAEGIYVGYRYFDSFYKTIKPADPAGAVNYPFGYGRSHTRFRINARSVRADAETVSVRAKVTNTGARSGKEVVQVYFSAPRGGTDKPYQELTAYGKTDELAPGASQTLTLSFPTTEMSSFDAARSAYLLDAGEYAIRVGSSSRSTRIVARLALASAVVTERVNHQMTDEAPEDELTSAPRNFYSYPGEAKERRSAPREWLNPRAFVTEDSRSPLEQTVDVPRSSGYHPIDGDKLSRITAYTLGESDWNATGSPYPRSSARPWRPCRPRPAAPRCSTSPVAT